MGKDGQQKKRVSGSKKMNLQKENPTDKLSLIEKWESLFTLSLKTMFSLTAWKNTSIEEKYVVQEKNKVTGHKAKEMITLLDIFITNKPDKCESHNKKSEHDI